jgi:CheY-like chemotaxis protein
VAQAADGPEALKLMRQRKDEIVLILLDLTMPQMHGEEVFRELRLIKSDVRVILTSGHNQHEAVNRFTGKGLVGFVQKPYRYDVLKEMIREALDS